MFWFYTLSLIFCALMIVYTIYIDKGIDVHHFLLFVFLCIIPVVNLATGMLLVYIIWGEDLFKKYKNKKLFKRN